MDGAGLGVRALKYLAGVLVLLFGSLLLWNWSLKDPGPERENNPLDAEDLALVPVSYTEQAVDGVLLRTFGRTETSSEATVVRFSDVMVIRTGNETVLCLLGFGLSEPPTCSGPELVGFEPHNGWARSVEEVSWGQHLVVVEWPPVNGRLQVLAVKAARRGPGFPELSISKIPEECPATMDTSVASAVMTAADASPDKTGFGSFIDGVFVQPVKTEQLDAFRAELGPVADLACLQPVLFSRTDVEDAAEILRSSELVSIEQGPLSSVSGANRSGRLLVTVAVADRKTAQEIATLLEDPRIAIISSLGEVLR